MTKNASTKIPQWVMDWALILAIVVLLVTFVNYGMSFLYPSPEYSDFCSQDEYRLVEPNNADTQASCEAAGGLWNPDATPRRIAEPTPETTSATSATSSITSGYCDYDHYCREAYQAATDIHDRNGLIAMLIIGLAVAVLGFRRKVADVLSPSFSIAGVIVILSGLIRYWTVGSDWAQFILLGSALLVFIYLAISRR